MARYDDGIGNTLKQHKTLHKASDISQKSDVANTDSSSVPVSPSVSASVLVKTKLPFEKLRRAIRMRKGVSGDFSHLTKIPEFYKSLRDKYTVEELLTRSFVVINKPAGPTSHQVAAYAKDILGVSISGHTGTLDPNVTGVLPVGLEKATKMIMGLLNTGKEYVCYMHVHELIDEEKIRSVCESFVGRITQLPPVKSAVKRQEREREIYYLQILEIQGRDVLFKVGCEAGTYIRKLCTDIGVELGCGAHMHQLIRTKAAAFSTVDMVNLEELRDAFISYKEIGDLRIKNYLYPVEWALSHLRKVYVFDVAAARLAHGAQLMVPGIFMCDENIKLADMVVVYDMRGNLVGIGTAKLTGKQMLSESKGLAVRMDRMFLQSSDVVIEKRAPKVIA
jgi:H/ACA ribonucleoprotein complex subunit 4